MKKMTFMTQSPRVRNALYGTSVHYITACLVCKPIPCVRIYLCDVKVYLSKFMTACKDVVPSLSQTER